MKNTRARTSLQLKWALIILATILIYAAARYDACRARGSAAVGGEVMLFALPLIYYSMEQPVKDWINSMTNRRKDGQ